MLLPNKKKHAYEGVVFLTLQKAKNKNNPLDVLMKKDKSELFGSKLINKESGDIEVYK